MPTLHSIVSGRVQGVGFRYFVRHEAVALGLSGWVRNLPSGQVEVKAGGDRATLEILAKRLQRGPALSRVKEVKVEWTDEEMEEPFYVR